MRHFVVHSIGFPCHLLIVYMNHQHSFGRSKSIPLAFLVILYNIIFICIGIIDNLVCRTAFAHGSECNVGWDIQYDQILPPEEVLLVACISTGSMSVVVVAAIVHQAPTVHTKSIRIVCWIEVGQTEAVRELMTECSYAVQCLMYTCVPSIQLVVTGILTDLHSVKRQFICQLPLMRPNGIL